MKKIIIAVLIFSILIFAAGCSKEKGSEGVILPDGTVLPPPDEAGPLPPPPRESPVASTPLPTLPGDAEEPPAETAVEEPGDETSAEPSEVTVQIKDFKFIPADLVVEKGTTVTWINLDTAPHTATSYEEYFDSGRLGKDQEFSFTFEEEGSWEYYCTFHPYMKATVSVE